MIAPRASTHIGMLLFPNMTQLDFTGPYEVFSRLPDATVQIVASSLDPVRTDRGLVLAPSTTYTACPQLDVVVVPGGPGQEALMQDEGVLDFLRQQAAGAKYVTSVCTGALVLGAAGLLTGYCKFSVRMRHPFSPKMCHGLRPGPLAARGRSGGGGGCSEPWHAARSIIYGSAA